MLHDRILTLRKIYGPKSATKRAQPPPNADQRPSRNATKTPSLPPATPQLNGRMAVYRSISALSSKYGRSPSRERLDNLQQELLEAKKHCLRLSQENTILRTRLRKLNSQSEKRELHLQSLINKKYEPAEVHDTNEAKTIIGYKQKLLKSHMLIKDQLEQIKQLKEERSARSNSATVRSQKAETPTTKPPKATTKTEKAPLKTRSSSSDSLLEENSRLLDKLKTLKHENKILRKRIAELERPSEKDSELSDWSKAELIALIERLESRHLRAPLRAAVATLEQSTEIGKMAKELKETKTSLVDSNKLNDLLSKEVEKLMNELKRVRVRETSEEERVTRPPQVPPLDMQSIENSEGSDAENNNNNNNNNEEQPLPDDGEFFEDVYHPDPVQAPPGEPVQIQPDFNREALAREVFYEARAHARRYVIGWDMSDMGGGSA